MIFLHPLLLGGLLLAGLPILLHLTMRQKPKRLPFPAFRFLLERQRSNQRALRLRHLLLLALRVGLVVLICLALARPRLFGGRLGGLGTGQPVAAVLLLDTSPSMEYTVNGKTRLDEARQKASELLDQLPAGSRVAIMDSAEVGGEWALTADQARKRLAELKLRSANGPVTRQLDQAFRLLKDVEQEGDETEPLPRYLYVVSDRTTACWDAAAAENLHPPEGVQAAFVDVGAKDPADVAIVSVEPDRQTIAAGDMVEVKVTVAATGIDGENELQCTFDDDRTPERKPVALKPGDRTVVTFARQTTAGTDNRTGLRAGWHQVTVRLAATDGLPGNNVGHCTFKVQEARRVLAIADDPADAAAWALALNRFRGAKNFSAFRCDKVLPSKAVDTLDLKDLRANYAAVLLIDVARPENELWDKLASFVREGGGLAIVPGGWEWQPDAERYNPDAPDSAAKPLLPGKLGPEVVVQPTEKAKGEWRELGPNAETKHPFLAPFRRWRKDDSIDFYQKDFAPWAERSWQVAPTEGGEMIASYGDGRPALLERTVGQGRVLMFTTAFDLKRPKGVNSYWNNYEESSFYRVLVNLAVGYLAGDREDTRCNFQCGESVPVPVPPLPFVPLYTLQGPGLPSAATLPREREQNKLTVTQATAAGNFTVLDDKGGIVGAFSMGPRVDEYVLEPVPAEAIEAVVGKDGIVSGDRPLSLDVVGGGKQPVELYPWLMIGLLLALAAENLLANKFYRRDRAAEEKEAVPAAA